LGRSDNVEVSEGASDRVSPRKALGQHFLRDRNIIRRIVEGAELSVDENVVEIGAGTGELTAELAARAGRVWAVEVDEDLCRRLRHRFEGVDNVEIVQADALRLDVAEFFGAREPYVVVANLPYNAGTAIVRQLLESEHGPQRLVVMLQKEVAESMLAQPGRMSLVSVGVQVYATGRRLFQVPPGAFLPPPKVRSAVVRLDVRAEPLVPLAERERFFEVVRAGFSAPRKTLKNSLANGLRLDPAEATEAIERAGIDPARRPQALSVGDWLRLSRSIDG
jgi:16S rRNA (adenine1518-N6/adenine1519-N6)-dimethyltransferase